MITCLFTFRAAFSPPVLHWWEIGLSRESRGEKLGHWELQCEYCLSHSPPAPPLSCRALSLLTLTVLRPPLLLASFLSVASLARLSSKPLWTSLPAKQHIHRIKTKKTKKNTVPPCRFFVTTTIHFFFIKICFMFTYDRIDWSNHAQSKHKECFILYLENIHVCPSNLLCFKQWSFIGKWLLKWHFRVSPPDPKTTSVISWVDHLGGINNYSSYSPQRETIPVVCLKGVGMGSQVCFNRTQDSIRFGNWVTVLSWTVYITEAQEGLLVQWTCRRCRYLC